MDTRNPRSAKTSCDQQDIPACLEIRQQSLTNLQLLGFDCAAMEAKYNIPFNKDMFNLPNKKGAEAVLYFLFSRLNIGLCRREFRDCWPIIDKKTESQFRKNACHWLQHIQKDEPHSGLPRINASLFLSSGGEKFCQFIFSFSTYVLEQVIRNELGVSCHEMLRPPDLTPHNKDFWPAIEKTVHCSAIQHRLSYLDHLGLLTAAQQSWKNYVDEEVRDLRVVAKKIRELEHEKVWDIETVARKESTRDSPTRAPRASTLHFDVPERGGHLSQRAQRVRKLWAVVDEFAHKTEYEREVVNSILDKSRHQQQMIDTSDMSISVPNALLMEREADIRRRQVENVYEAGELNLVSILHLWNLALSMYMERLQREKLRDVSKEAASATSHAHTHHAYLSRATALRDKMAEEIPKRKEMVSRLRAQFHSEATFQVGGLKLNDPSPKLKFEPSHGARGQTPSGPFVQRTPQTQDLVDTPEAASAIVDRVVSSARRQLMTEAETLQAFGVKDRDPSNSDLNRNNSNAVSSKLNQDNSKRLPSKTAQESRLPRGRTDSGFQPSTRKTGHAKNTGPVQPRVVRHISRQPAAAAKSSTQQKSGPAPGKKTSVGEAYQLASTPERPAPKKTADTRTTPVTVQPVKQPAETPRQRAHNILADKIVWSVMHGESEEEGEESDQQPTTDFLQPHSSALGSMSRDQHLALLDNFLQQNTIPKSHPTSQNQQRLSQSETQVNRPVTSLSEMASEPLWHQTLTGDTQSPKTIVQQAWEAIERQRGEKRSGGTHSTGTQQLVHEDAEEAEDVNLQDPLAALSEDAFAKHDLIHRSPIHQDIHRMWQDVLNQSKGTEGENVEESQPAANSSQGSSHSFEGTLSPPGRTFITSEDSTFAHATTPETAVGRASRDTELEDSPRTPTSSFVAVREGKLDMPAESRHFAESSGGSPGFEGEESLGQTLIGDGLAFATSFDEPMSLDWSTSGKMEGRRQWEERTSALYNDDELDNKENAEGQKSGEQTLSLDKTLDEIFGSRTPSKSRGRPLTLFSDSVSRKPTSNGNSVLTPLTPWQSAETVKNILKTEVTPKRGGACAAGTSDARTVSDSHSQRDEIDRLLDLSPPPSADRLRTQFKSPSTKNTSPKKVTFSPENSLLQVKTDSVEDLLADDDFTVLSPLNDSFTPLRSGFLLQGKSPARPTQTRQRPQISKTSSAETNNNHVGTKDVQDEDLAARLTRLRKMAAEALKSCQESGADAGGHTEEEEEGGVHGGDSRGMVSSSPRPVAVGGSQQRISPPAGQYSIFDEDDSVLLPTSPS